jgi:hypothetical protein
LGGCFKRFISASLLVLFHLFHEVFRDRSAEHVEGHPHAFELGGFDRGRPTDAPQQGGKAQDQFALDRSVRVVVGDDRRFERLTRGRPNRCQSPTRILVGVSVGWPYRRFARSNGSARPIENIHNFGFVLPKVMSFY